MRQYQKSSGWTRHLCAICTFRFTLYLVGLESSYVQNGSSLASRSPKWKFKFFYFSCQEVRPCHRVGRSRRKRFLICWRFFFFFLQPFLIISILLSFPPTKFPWFCFYKYGDIISTERVYCFGLKGVSLPYVFVRRNATPGCFGRWWKLSC